VKIWYHGTNMENALKIRQEGFKSGTWFASHLEDALAFGGNCVFEVALKINEEDRWQICLDEPVPESMIIAHHVFQKECLLDRPDLRREVFEANRNGSVSGLEGKVEYHKWTSIKTEEPPIVIQ
jgi:hypothetical protein